MHFENSEDKIARLQEALDQAKEDLFLFRSDFDQLRTENIALKNFIQNLYDSCGDMEEVELKLSDVLKNLKENIRVFAKDNNIRL